MIKHTVIIPLFVLAEISQVVTASQETPNIDPAAPISKYSLEVQEAA